MKSSEKNRFQNAFTVCNVALDSVVSDMFGKSATAITDYLTSDVEFDAQHCISLLQRSLKKKAPAILEAVEGHEIAPEQKTRIGIVRDHLHYIDKLVERVDDCVEGMVQKHEGSITLLRTIPGVDRSSAITILSEIGIDMAQFGSSKRLCCWAGLTPGNNESAGKKKSVRISRAGVYLKPALVQVAHAAVKDKSSTYYAVKYERISKRRGKKRAIIAIARMILTAVFLYAFYREVWAQLTSTKLMFEATLLTAAANFFLLGVIDLDDVAIDQHLAGVSAEVVRPQLAHLMVDEFSSCSFKADFLSDGSRAIWHVLLPPSVPDKTHHRLSFRICR